MTVGDSTKGKTRWSQCRWVFTTHVNSVALEASEKRTELSQGAYLASRQQLGIKALAEDESIIFFFYMMFMYWLSSTSSLHKLETLLNRRTQDAGHGIVGGCASVFSDNVEAVLAVALAVLAMAASVLWRGGSMINIYCIDVEDTSEMCTTKKREEQTQRLQFTEELILKFSFSQLFIKHKFYNRVRGASEKDN
uniref:Uncharacterized protein n=1 Tax=Glossina brevipalpis TaxID=37001 RepID=A0A1A9WHF2_9MUSC